MLAIGYHRGVRRPTYPLARVVTLARSIGARRITRTAEISARDELGLPRDDVYELVARLTTRDFHKTMESRDKPGLYQDVYRPTVVTPRHPHGAQVYCKVQLVDMALVRVVVSCKRR